MKKAWLFLVCCVFSVFALFPQHHAAITRCGDLFERALYAKDTLSAGERDEFAGCVRDITMGGGTAGLDNE
jgi:hypothetical protein